MAQTPSPAPNRTVVRAGKLLDMRTGKTLTNQAIVVEDGNMVSVASDIGAVPEGAKVAACFWQDGASGPSRCHEKHYRRKKTRGLRGWRNLPRFATWAPRTLPTLPCATLSMPAMCRGPGIDARGLALSISGGHCDDNLLPYEWRATAVGVADGVENVQHKVREVIKYGANVIKICATGGVLSVGDNPQHSQFTPAELNAIGADPHRLGRKLPAHAMEQKVSVGRLKRASIPSSMVSTSMTQNGKLGGRPKKAVSS